MARLTLEEFARREAARAMSMRLLAERDQLLCKLFDTEEQRQYAETERDQLRAKLLESLERLKALNDPRLSPIIFDLG